MKTLICVMTVLTAALGAASIAGAAGQVNLSSSQEQQIEQDLSTAKAQSAPSGFKASVGEKVPSSISLQALPSSAPNSVKNDQAAKLDNGDIMIADPSTKEIVAVIQSKGTTGRSSSSPSMSSVPSSKTK